MSRPNDRVYFMQAGTSGLIKIGHSMDVETRRTQLMRETGESLSVLYARSGGRGAEQHMHQAFAADRVHGEWFRPSENLLWFIGWIQKLDAAREAAFWAHHKQVEQEAGEAWLELHPDNNDPIGREAFTEGYAEAIDRLYWQRQSEWIAKEILNQAQPSAEQQPAETRRAS